MNQTARTAPSRLPLSGRALALVVAGLSLTACETAGNLASGIVGSSIQAGTPGFVSGFLGGVAAEEPVAAATARNVLSAGGNAADAAVAAGFVMAVTLP